VHLKKLVTSGRRQKPGLASGAPAQPTLGSVGGVVTSRACRKEPLQNIRRNLDRAHLRPGPGLLTFVVHAYPPILDPAHAVNGSHPQSIARWSILVRVLSISEQSSVFRASHPENIGLAGSDGPRA
jgi:hypothetical protein